jgi:DNA-binding helix-hairpin-helix protein with protein kinase domain
MRLYNSQGAAVEVADKIAQGGEGAVHRVIGSADVVAKIYHKPPSEELGRKLDAMVRAKSPEILRLACWPTDLLTAKPSGSVTGFLMPNAAGYKDAFKLYNPKARQSEFQSVNWGFLVRVGANMARAFATIHQAGHVIGDVNHSSVFIAPDATVKLIDCDSFQVRLNGEQFRCTVGEALHTAPELQGVNLGTVERTANQDNFGLAVLIFQLLFMGRHPFAGGFAGGDMSLEEKIKGFRFAYGPGAKDRKMSPPPATLPLEAVSTQVAELFEAAFSPEGASDSGRPEPVRWVEELSRLERDLKKCTHDTAHVYWSGLPVCPWCEIESRTGITNFSVAYAPRGGAAAPLDFGAIWRSIGQIPKPEKIKIPSPTSIPKVEPDPKFLAIATSRKVARLLGVILVLGSGVLTAVSTASYGGAFLAMLLAMLLFGCAFGLAFSPSAKRADTRYQLAKGRYQNLYSQWQATADSQLFSARVKELEQRRNQYQDLEDYRRRGFEKLQATIRERQLARFLDRYPIEPGAAPGIGAGRCATLSSYGMDTAADVELARVKKVPGFGSQLSSNLVEWRRGLEAQFRFNPGLGVDAGDVQKLDAEVAHLRESIDAEMQNAPSELRQLEIRIKTAQNAMRPQLEQAAAELAKAEANFKAL